MTKTAIQLLLWWLPAFVLAAVAGVMPDTFLDSPYTTIPHEAAFKRRFWIILLAFAYILLAFAIRVTLYLGTQSRGGERRGFAVEIARRLDESSG